MVPTAVGIDAVDGAGVVTGNGAGERDVVGDIVNQVPVVVGAEVLDENVGYGVFAWFVVGAGVLGANGALTGGGAAPNGGRASIGDGIGTGTASGATNREGKRSDTGAGTICNLRLASTEFESITTRA